MDIHLKAMIIATYVGNDENMKICKELGFSIFQTDSDHISTNETERDQWDWKVYDETLERVHQVGAHWMFFPHFAFPPHWYKKSEEFVKLRCLEHDQTIEAFSIWEPKAIEYMEHGYKALAEHYESGNENIYAFYLGVHGDYGECMFPAACRINAESQKEDWLKRFGDLHNHYGFWCGDELARADFKKSMLEKYKGLEDLNKTWQTSFTMEKEITYPDNSQKHRWWLDFIRWYLDSMVYYSSKVAAAANTYFPQSMKMFPLGAEDEDPRLGQDYSALVKMAKEAGVEIRSTHGGFRSFAANASSQLIHIATACKYYGVPFWSEPPSNISAERLVSRIFETICCGSSGYWDWHVNPVIPENRAIMEKYKHLLVVDKPIVEVALLFPQTYHYLHPENGFPVKFLEYGQELREFVSFDILDERLIEDGALSNYKYLIHIEGDIFQKETIVKIGEWVNRGGVFCTCLPEKIETVEGDSGLIEKQLNIDFSVEGEIIKMVGDGVIFSFKGKEEAKENYFKMIEKALSFTLQGKIVKPSLYLDTEIDGVYGVILESGRTLLYNSTSQLIIKSIAGKKYEIAGFSITEVQE